MSAGVCGKRLGFEEIFGSSPPSSSAKRSRCSSFGSQISSSEFGFGSEDKVSILLRMFPGMDRELVESVLRTHNNKIEDATESLHVLCLADVSPKDEPQDLDSMVIGVTGSESSQISEQQVEDLQENNSKTESEDCKDGSSWVDIIVQEMMNAVDLDDARGRAAKILEAFEKSVVSSLRDSKEQEELASLKEHLQGFLRDNQLLKRAIAIQHERNLEQGEKIKEAEQLKRVISQYQEQVQTLELNNYTLKFHLQKAQESSSIPGRFHPDIF